jgi:virginiamycin B lyase
VDTGVDSNDSGVLDAPEIQHTTYVCAVAAGGTGGTGGVAECPTLTEFDLPAPVGALTAGPDHNLWLTSNQNIIRMTTAGVFTTFTLGSTLGPLIVAGSDGNVWWSAYSGTLLVCGRITPDGVIIRNGDCFGVSGISTGPGAGYLWFTSASRSLLSSLPPNGGFSIRYLFRALGEIVHANGAFWGIAVGGIGFITDYDAQGYLPNLPPAPVVLFPTSYAVSNLAAGPDGTVWFTTLLPPEPGASVKIGRISPSKELREFVVGGTTAARPAVAPDGAAWTVFESLSGGAYLARFTSSGEMTKTCPVPSAGGAITLGPDQRMWFTEPAQNRIAAFTP